MPNPNNLAMLEVTHVHDMNTFRTELDGVNVITYNTKPFRGKPLRGQPASWVEAAVKSNVVNLSLKRNLDLELGAEAAWSPEELRDLGAFEDLAQTATAMAKHMDAVGYWNDNHRADMIEKHPERLKGPYRPLGAHAPKISSRDRVVFW